MKAWAPSHPFDPAAKMGAMVSAAHAQKVIRAIRSAEQAGARVLTGGREVEIEGIANYVQPTLLDEVHEEMSLWKDEIFGPVLAAIPLMMNSRPSSWLITIFMPSPRRSGQTICTARTA